MDSLGRVSAYGLPARLSHPGPVRQDCPQLPKMPLSYFKLVTLRFNALERSDSVLVINARNRTKTLLVKITSKRQVTLPAHVLDAMGVGPGDTLQLIPDHDGYLLRPRHIDYSRLGTLRGKIPAGHPPFDIRSFRENPYDPELRD